MNIKACVLKDTYAKDPRLQYYVVGAKVDTDKDEEKGGWVGCSDYSAAPSLEQAIARLVENVQTNPKGRP